MLCVVVRQTASDSHNDLSNFFYQAAGMMTRVTFARWGSPKRMVRLLALAVVGLTLGRLTGGEARVTGEFQAPLRSSDIFALVKTLRSAENLGGAYPSVVKLAFESWGLNSEDLTAFEENRFFVYAVAATWNSRDNPHRAPEAKRLPRLVRRFIFLRPSILVVDDEVLAPSSGVAASWWFRSQKMPEVTGRRARLAEGKAELFLETLLPSRVAYRLARPSSDDLESGYLLEITSSEGSERTRFLHVMHTQRVGHEQPEAQSTLIVAKDRWELVISAKGRVFRLNLPPLSESAGEIGIFKADGKNLLYPRPFPSGVLPHGPEGIRLLERWDAVFAGPQRPVFDLDHPSAELRRLVEEGTVRPSRALELCSGTGTDAIYLASRGFEVTAIDIAPMALVRAQQKARKAGVSVRWLLADVLAPPNLRPFDFIYDRGCYHEVRAQNLAAYLESLRRFSRPGTRFLLLAGSANELPRDYGPPGVTEKAIRRDFSPLFEIEWLRETRFEMNHPGIQGPLAWSVLLRRKATP